MKLFERSMRIILEKKSMRHASSKHISKSLVALCWLDRASETKMSMRHASSKHISKSMLLLCLLDLGTYFQEFGGTLLAELGEPIS